jgi:hypothetical protein
MADLNTDMEDVDTEEAIKQQKLAELRMMQMGNPMMPTMSAVSALPPTPQGGKDMQQMLREKLMQSMAGQDNSLDLQRKLLAAQAAAPAQMDLSPTLNLIASYTGDKNYGSSYKAQNKQADLTSAMGAYTKEQNTLTDQQQKILKDELNARTNASLAQAQRLLLGQDRLKENVYGKVVSGISKDTVLNDTLRNNNSLNRTFDSMFAPGQKISMSTLNDVQQTVIGSLNSLKGSGGVAERKDRTIETLANDYQTLIQKFGDLDAVPSDDPTLVHFISVAKEGQKKILSQANQRLESLASGHENITELPTYKPMLENFKSKYKEQLVPSDFLSKQNMGQANLTRSDSGTAVASPQPMPQDAFIEAYLAKKKGTSK